MEIVELIKEFHIILRVKNVLIIILFLITNVKKLFVYKVLSIWISCYNIKSNVLRIWKNKKRLSWQKFAWRWVCKWIQANQTKWKAKKPSKFVSTNRLNQLLRAVQSWWSINSRQPQKLYSYWNK